MRENLADTISEVFKILDENIEILSNISGDFEDDKEDQFIPNMELYQLLDMTEDVSESSKIKLAEFKLSRRQVDYSL